jgi:hypothetical protein
LPRVLASSPEWSEFLPKIVLAPDLPVPKRSKQRLRDVTVNDGLHWHGLMLVSPLASKLQARLDDHINGNLGKYLVGSIREIGITAITHAPEYLTPRPGAQSLTQRNGTFDEEPCLGLVMLTGSRSNGFQVPLLIGQADPDHVHPPFLT